MSKIYLEILDKKRQEYFKKLAYFKRMGYLAGGTALAMQVNHRRSVDFDIFTPKPITNTLKLKVEKIFGKQDFYINTSDQISFKTENEIGITFVWYYFKPIYSFVKTLNFNLASIGDIAADKAQTIGRRAVWRDYVDLFFLLKNKLTSMEKIMKDAKKKFGGEFVETQFLEQLSYFGDLAVSPVDWIGQGYTSSEIKAFLERQVERYVKKIIV